MPSTFLPALSLLAARARQSFDVEAATRTYLDRVPAEEVARTAAYVDGGYWLLLWGTLLRRSGRADRW